jgi:hypothetical protein
VRIDIGEAEDESISSLATETPQYFWDHDEIPSKHRRHLLTDMDTPGAKILSNPGARLVKQIDLRNTKLQSLTMACNHLGITDIRINGHTKMSIGPLSQHRSVKTHFLYPGESIKSAHLVIRGQQRPLMGFGPYLLVSIRLVDNKSYAHIPRMTRSGLLKAVHCTMAHVSRFPYLLSTLYLLTSRKWRKSWVFSTTQ